jgi:hypothetical protein
MKAVGSRIVRWHDGEESEEWHPRSGIRGLAWASCSKARQGIVTRLFGNGCFDVGVTLVDFYNMGW